MIEKQGVYLMTPPSPLSFRIKTNKANGDKYVKYYVCLKNGSDQLKKGIVSQSADPSHFQA